MTAHEDAALDAMLARLDEGDARTAEIERRVALLWDDPEKVAEAWRAVEDADTERLFAHVVSCSFLGHKDDMAVRAARLHIIIHDLIAAQLTEMANDDLDADILNPEPSDD